MLLELKIDLFLDELVAAYDSIASDLHPFEYSHRKYNPGYRKAFEYYSSEKEKLHEYVVDGFFVSAASREKVLDSLETGLELLRTLKAKNYCLDDHEKRDRLIEEVARLAEMVDLIDILEDE